MAVAVLAALATLGTGLAAARPARAAENNKQVSIIFDPNGGKLHNTSDSSREVKIGYPIGKLPTATLNGESTSNWNTHRDGSGLRIDKDWGLDKSVTVYAQYDEIYTIKFDANGGKFDDGVPKDKEIKDGYPVGQLPFVSSSKSDFYGWYTAKTDGTLVSDSWHPTKNTTLYARWGKGSPAILVAYANWGSYGSDLYHMYSTNMDTEYALLGSPIALTVKTPDKTPFYRIGYHIASWNTQPNGKGKSYPEGYVFHLKMGSGGLVSSNVYSQDINLYAQWAPGPVVPTSYTVTFNPNGGTLDKPSDNTKLVKTGSMLGSLPLVSFAGHQLTGWNTKQDGTGESVTANFKPKEDTTVYAQWKQSPSPAKKQIWLYLCANWGTHKNECVLSTETDIPNGSTTANAGIETTGLKNKPDFNRKDATIQSWNTDPNGKGQSYAYVANDIGDAGYGLQNVKEGTYYLYAQWKANAYTITADANGGTFPNGQSTDTVTVTAGGHPSVPAPTRKGYKFTGWTDDSGKTVDPATWTPTGDSTIHAQWKLVPAIQDLPQAGSALAIGVPALLVASFGAGVALLKKRRA